jgi:PEP-utilising enzyme, mobile domain
MQLIATGLNAFNTPREPEGVVKFLGSPIEVLDLVTSGEANRFIILAQGGTTTFLSPILAEGTLGILTMSGAPQSHLGILSREFQIPCVMTIALEGWDQRYVPGESGTDYFRHIVKTLDGRRVRMVCSDPTTATVWSLDG